MIIEPDEVNLAIIFKACGQLNNDRAIKLGKKFLHQNLHRIQNDKITLTSAINMCMKFNDIKTAEYIFKMMKNKDIVTYGSLMKGNLLTYILNIKEIHFRIC